MLGQRLDPEMGLLDKRPRINHFRRLTDNQFPHFVPKDVNHTRIVSNVNEVELWTAAGGLGSTCPCEVKAVTSFSLQAHNRL